MTYVITGACSGVKDQSCVEVCPVGCIYFEAEDSMCYIRAEECINCAVCVEACPVGAIFAEDDLPAEGRAFLEINTLWFADKDAARDKVALAVAEV